MKKLSAATVFAQKLIIKKSVTPNDAGAIKVLKEKLSEIGFSNIDLPFGSEKNNDLIHNLFSVKNSKKLNKQNKKESKVNKRNLRKSNKKKFLIF